MRRVAAAAMLLLAVCAVAAAEDGRQQERTQEQRPRHPRRALQTFVANDGGGGPALPRSLSGGNGAGVLPLLALWDVSAFKPAVLIGLWCARLTEFIFSRLRPLAPFAAVGPRVTVIRTPARG